MRDQLISTDGGAKTQLSQTAALGNHFSSIAQLNACGNLQMTELSSLEGGGRVRQKVFLCLVLTSGKPNYHQHSSGLCRSIRRPTPPENIIHIIVETESWFLFFCLVDDLWVVEQFEYGVEKKLKQEDYQYIVASGWKKKQHVVRTEYRVRSSTVI